MLISLVVPCYNEEKVLGLFYKEFDSVTQKIPEYSFELILINDGSKDKTLDVITALADKDKRVKYISFSRNFGKEAALLAGLKYSRGDIIGVIDADLQDPPSLMPEMIKYIVEDGYDCVATRRVDRKGEPPVRSFFARSFYRIINKMSSTNIVDGARDYRMMTRQMVDAILGLTEYHRFSKGIFSWVGFDTKWIEFENVERAAGETKWSFFKLFSYAVEGIVGFTTTPLRFATIMGMLVSTVAFLYLLFIFFRTLIFGVDVPGYASLMTVQLFLGGTILIALGVLGEYMSKTYMETKKRPNYIVKKTNIKEGDEDDRK